MLGLSELDMLQRASVLHMRHKQAIAASAGTYDEPKCMWKSDDLDHAVALVGYGTDEAGTGYWIIKNSWSSHW